VIADLGVGRGEPRGLREVRDCLLDPTQLQAGAAGVIASFGARRLEPQDRLVREEGFGRYKRALSSANSACAAYSPTMKRIETTSPEPARNSSLSRLLPRRGAKSRSANDAFATPMGVRAVPARMPDDLCAFL
jgi:hypothetical protein